MPYNKERIEELLVRVLSTLAEATFDVNAEDTNFGTIYSPVLKYTPNFEFTKDDIRLIKELGEDNMEDFSTLTEC